MLREGELLSMEMPLVRAHRLVPVHINNKPPQFFIIAGLVFTQVGQPALGRSSDPCNTQCLVQAPSRARLCKADIAALNASLQALQYYGIWAFWLLK